MTKDGKVLFPIAPVEEPGRVWGFEAQEWKDNQRRYAEQTLDGCPVRTANAVSYRLLSQVIMGRNRVRLDIYWLSCYRSTLTRVNNIRFRFQTTWLKVSPRPHQLKTWRLVKPRPST